MLGRKFEAKTVAELRAHSRNSSLTHSRHMLLSMVGNITYQMVVSIIGTGVNFLFYKER
jgi:hypothetical protein